MKGTLSCSTLEANLLASTGALVLIACATSPKLLLRPREGERGEEEGGGEEGGEDRKLLFDIFSTFSFFVL